VADAPKDEYNSRREAASESEPARSDNIDREDFMCRIRQRFANGATLVRETAIDELLSDPETAAATREQIDGLLRSAVRRGILANESGSLRLAARSIEQYERAFLKEQFLASLAGGAWAEQDDAIRTFSRWLGFARTGPAINEASRSLINGLLREGRLERDGERLRKAR
jgi:hypothetical protein